MTVKCTEDHFIIEYDENDDKRGYIFRTKQGKEFARGSTYCTGDENKRYFAVQDEKRGWTLYNKNGQPIKGAQEADHIYWNKKCYIVGLGEDKKTYFFPEYRVKQVLCGLGVMGALIVTGFGVLQIHGCCEKRAEYEQKTQMTYLGISNGVAMFDTDGDQQTAEVVSSTPSKGNRLSNRQIGRLYGCEGQTHSIVKWKEMTGIYAFEHVR